MRTAIFVNPKTFLTDKTSRVQHASCSELHCYTCKSSNWPLPLQLLHSKLV